MRKAQPSLRMIALLGAGSTLVHELRYVVGYRGFAQQALFEQGHSYLTWLEALVVVLLIGAGIGLGVSLVRARCGRAEREIPSFNALWLRAGLALACIYTLQEGFEGALAPGHPAGIVGVFGNGGWTALLFAALVGGLVAAILRATYHVIRYVAKRSAEHRRPTRARRLRGFPGFSFARRLDVLAYNLAGRAPPLRS